MTEQEELMQEMCDGLSEEGLSCSVHFENKQGQISVNPFKMHLLNQACETQIDKRNT